MQNNESKNNNSGGGLFKLIIIAVLLWFAYDNLIAKHWQVLYSDTINAGWIVDSTSPKFKKQEDCVNYAASLQVTGTVSVFRYSCGYKCKTPSNDIRATCKKQS